MKHTHYPKGQASYTHGHEVSGGSHLHSRHEVEALADALQMLGPDEFPRSFFVYLAEEKLGVSR